MGVEILAVSPSFDKQNPARIEGVRAVGAGQTALGGAGLANAIQLVADEGLPSVGGYINRSGDDDHGRAHGGSRLRSKPPSSLAKAILRHRAKPLSRDYLRHGNRAG